MAMEIDTGSTVPIISESVYKNIFETQIPETLQQTEAKLCTYSGEQLLVKGNTSWRHYFCKIRHEQAYQQLLLDNSSKEVVTINTHEGLLSYQCLPFRVSFHFCSWNILKNHGVLSARNSLCVSLLGWHP